MAIDHYAFGVHSNIPVCCVKFFIGEWRSMDVNASSRDSNPRVNYVRCPKCLKTNRIANIHECSTKCLAFFKQIDHEIMVRLLTTEELDHED